jgi:hypothetical protein
MIEVYPDDSLNAQAILLAVETGIAPDVWLELDIIGMNTAMKYLRARIRREASYLGAKIRGEEVEQGADDAGRQMSG